MVDRFSYTDAVSLVHQGFVPLLMPLEEGVMMFVVRPAEAFFSPSQKERQIAMITMMTRAVKMLEEQGIEEEAE